MNSEVGKSYRPSHEDTMAASYIEVPIFAGQDTDAIELISACEQALRDATLPSGSLLLSSCFDAFCTELSALSSTEVQQYGIDKAHFKTPKDILSGLPGRYENNPIVSGTKLCLLQCLRYLAHIESSGTSSSQFADALQSNACHNLGVLGFSSGILPACVVAASGSVLTYISYSVEAFKLALWVGVRTLFYRHAFRSHILMRRHKQLYSNGYSKKLILAQPRCRLSKPMVRGRKPVIPTNWRVSGAY